MFKSANFKCKDASFCFRDCSSVVVTQPVIVYAKYIVLKIIKY